MFFVVTAILLEYFYPDFNDYIVNFEILDMLLVTLSQGVVSMCDKRINRLGR